MGARPVAGPGRAAAVVLAALLPASVLVPGGAARAQQARSADPPLQRGSPGAGTADFEPPPAQASDFPLTIRSVMRGPEIVGKPPEDVRWTDDSRWIYFRWLPGGRAWHEDRKLHRVPAEGGEPEELSEAAADTLAPLFADGDLSPDRSLRVSAVRGDLYLVERADLRVTRLTRTRVDESMPRFSADGRRVFFRRENDLFALDLDDARIRQLTDIRSGPPEEEEDTTARERFLRERQEELFERIRIDEEQERELEAREERLEAEAPEPFHLRSGEDVRTLVAEPGGRWALAVITLEPEGARRTSVPDWITDSGYTEILDARPLVGDRQTAFRVVRIDLESGEAEEVGPLTGTDSAGDGRPAGVSGAPDTAAAAGRPEAADTVEGHGAEAADTTVAVTAGTDGRSGAPDHPDLATLRFHGWSDSGDHALLSAVDHDYEEWRLYSVAAGKGAVTELASHRDTAWVDGPCFLDCIGWIPDTERAYYVSEATGWAHLYTVEAGGGEPWQLTGGEWEVHSVRIPEEGDHFLLEATANSPFDLHVYRLALDGSDRTRLTAGRGRFEAVPSPDGERLAVVHSRSNRPPELYVAEISGAGERITTSPTSDWLAFPWIRPEIVRFEARDGTRVPARIYRPRDLGAEPNGAGVVFVHGAGYLHNVHHWWSSYYREYMFHHLLAARGYTVLDVDYRGSAGYGRDWRAAVYRHMGGKDLSDQIDGVRWLVEEEGVDADRVGIYGGSYGGFITLMALFTTEDVFRAGAALRSVTDWSHYNHWYTSRILNLPHEDTEAYRRSSPVYLAEGLDPDERLLVLHGMRDTNVLFSDVVRLTQRLVELGKETWEMAVYPAEGHGFEAPSSWTDEYRRIFELFEETIGAGREAPAEDP